MDRTYFHMDTKGKSNLFDPLTIRDPQTKDISLQVSGFGNAKPFTTLQQNPHFSILLVRIGKGRAIRDGADFSFEKECLLCFSIYQPYIIVAEGDFEGVLLNFHPSYFCLFEHRHEVSCNGVLLLKNFDILAEGDSMPVVKIFDHLQASADGKVEIYFMPVVNYPVVSALELRNGAAGSWDGSGLVPCDVRHGSRLGVPFQPAAAHVQSHGR